MFIGGMETGGTKTVCAVSDPDHPQKIIEKILFPTTTPAETVSAAADFFRPFMPASIGIASFGPVDLSRSSESWGYVTTTPKPGWRFADLAGPFRTMFDCPVSFETDVNGALAGEMYCGAAAEAKNAAYYTVGTGIGLGLCVSGNLVHGLLHPEAGHFYPKRYPGDVFPGACPYHSDCLEGLASGEAIAARWKLPAAEALKDPVALDMEAYYLAQAAVNAILFASPEIIIMGGGVMTAPGLLKAVREKTVSLLAGYLSVDRITANIDNYLVPPVLGDDAGVTGALVLAAGELQRQ